MGSNKILLTIIIALLVFLLAVGGWFWWRHQIGVAGRAGTIVEIDASSKSQLADQLVSKHLIRSKFIFSSKWGNRTLPLKGFYSLGGVNLVGLIDVLSKGPNIVKLTIPEGFSSMQIAQRLESDSLPGAEFLQIAQKQEGQLFPDTYFIKTDATAQDIIKKLVDNYGAKTADLGLKEDDLKLASIVEREAKKEEERSQIAAVYKNRLAQGMKLEADPTVQYARDLMLINGSNLADIKLWQPLASRSTGTIVSPYNTYLNTGLPPTPICNPGLPSMQAALNPTPNFNSLYFFHDKDGLIHFSATFADHQAAIKKFGL